jgi:hypothetical protein
MITRLMLSLKKAASTENGWSFTEMTSVRRVDESIHIGCSDHPQPSHDVARTRMGFRARRTEELGVVSVEVPEEIVMANAK